MAYKTKRQGNQVNYDAKIGEIPVEAGVTVTVTQASANDKYLNLTLKNSFGEPIKDRYLINGPRHHFLLAAAYSKEEMKEVVDSEDWTHILNKKFTVDIMKEVGAEILLDPRSKSIQLKDPQGEVIAEFDSYEDARTYARKNGIRQQRKKITNHRSAESTTSSRLPESMRF